MSQGGDFDPVEIAPRHADEQRVAPVHDHAGVASDPGRVAVGPELEQHPSACVRIAVVQPSLRGDHPAAPVGPLSRFYLLRNASVNEC